MHRRMRSRGFTLIEMIISITIFSIIAVIGMQIIANGMQVAIVTNDNTKLSGKLAYAMDRMARDIREVSISSGAYVISTSTSTSFSFTRRDGTVVTFTGSGSNITMTYVSGGTTTAATLTDDLSSLTFSYLDVSGNAAASGTLTTDVRFVEIDLTLANATSGASYHDTVRVALRETG